MELDEDKDESNSEIIYIEDKEDENEEKNKKNKFKSKNNLSRKRKIILDNEEENNVVKKKIKSVSIKISDDKTKEDNTNKIIPITKHSSLNPNLFSDEYIKDYKCILCGLIPSFEEAEEAICCGYLFCEQCEKTWEEKKKGCPICGISISKLKTRKIKEYNKIFYKSLKNFEIKCPYKCSWSGAWGDLETHLLKCELSYRYCIYKLIGCEYSDENKKVKEHEESNDKLHLELAVKFIKDKNLIKKELKFELGEKCITTCHPHPLSYSINREAPWICDGDQLELGCENYGHIISKEKPRYRCDLCNFDLCDSCVAKYYKLSL